MQKAAITVGFRIDPHHYDLLAGQAKLLGESVGDVARRLVIQKLNEKDEVAVISEKMTAVERQLLELRKDFAISVQVLLAFAGNIKEHDAKTWVAENLKRT